MTETIHDTNDDDEICPICLDSLQFSLQGSLPLPCSHQFHADCLLSFFENQLPSDWKCPVCRFSILGTSDTSSSTYNHHLHHHHDDEEQEQRRENQYNTLHSRWMRMQNLFQNASCALNQKRTFLSCDVHTLLNDAPSTSCIIHRQSPYIDSQKENLKKQNCVGMNAFMESIERYCPALASAIIMYYGHAQVQHLLYTVRRSSLNNKDKKYKNECAPPPRTSSVGHDDDDTVRRRRGSKSQIIVSIQNLFSACPFDYTTNQQYSSNFSLHNNRIYAQNPLFYALKYIFLLIISLFAMASGTYALYFIMRYLGNSVCAVADTLQGIMALKFDSDTLGDITNSDDVSFSISQCQPMIPQGMWLPLGFAVLSGYISIQIAWIFGITLREMAMKFDEVIAFKMVGLWWCVCCAYTLFVYAARLFLTCAVVLSGGQMLGLNGCAMVVGDEGLLVSRDSNRGGLLDC